MSRFGVDYGMEIIADYYNNLFTIEIAVVGIISAVFFVFLQIIYTKYSYREVKVMLQNKYLISYFLINAVLISYTAFGSLFMSFKHDYFKCTNFYSAELYNNENVAAISLMLFILSHFLFVLFAYTNFKFFQPSKIALYFGEKIGNKQIKYFLLHKYGVPSPKEWDMLKNFSITYGGDVVEGNQNEIAKKEQAKSIERKIQLEKNKKEYELIKKQIKGTVNPFEPINNLIINSINSMDLTTLQEALAIIIDISDKFIKKDRDVNTDNWNPYSGMYLNYITYTKEMLYTFIQMCDRQNMSLAKSKIIEASYRVFEITLNKNNDRKEVIIIFDLWKKIADNEINRSTDIFRQIINSYAVAGENIFKLGFDNGNNYEYLNEIFRDLGWLAERLIKKQGIEEKPLMYDRTYHNEYDALFNTLLSFEDIYNNDYPQAYPLVYFAAIHVLFKQLIRVYKESNNDEIKHHMFSCFYVFYSFAEKAIYKKNGDGASLSVSKLRECCDELISANIEENAKESIDLLIGIGALASGHKKDLNIANFMMKSIDEYVIDYLASIPLGNIDSVVMEVFIKRNHGDKGAWIFITSLGKRLKTNFGFNFDWKTGESYSDNDYRRH